MRGPLAAAARGENMSITNENHMDFDTHDELETGLETKAGIPSDAVVTHAELMRAFEEFKEANEQKLAEKRSIDVVLEQKNRADRQHHHYANPEARRRAGVTVLRDPYSARPYGGRHAA